MGGFFLLVGGIAVFAQDAFDEHAEVSVACSRTDSVMVVMEMSKD